MVGNPKFYADRKAGKKATEIDKLTGESKRLQEANKFFQQAIELLEPGGYLGMLMPQSFSVSAEATDARKKLLEQCDILELWDLPLTIFEDQAAVSPMVIFAKKREKVGQPMSYPVRIRVAQGKTFERTGIFDASSLAISQTKWGMPGQRAHRPQSKVTHLITYATLLTETKWNEIRGNCYPLTEIADITLGAIVGTKRPWADFPKPKQVPWLSNAKQSIPYPFLVSYGSDTILYPNELERPRKNRRYPQRDKEHLLAAKKVLLVSDPNPSWGKRSKVAIDRRGFYPSNHFWVCVPKPNAVQSVSLEVLAAVLSWDVSNAWLVESFRNPWIQKRVLEDIPFPKLSDNDCRRLEKAIIEIEAAAQGEQLAPRAQRVLDQVLKKAYG
ncbi:MAG: Eco57I restriction-modification methylase domain-containing protein, partial [Nitrososphaerales archaeon]